jgi:hypothetical protein
MQAAGILGLHHEVEMSEVRDGPAVGGAGCGVRTRAELGEDSRNKLSGAVTNGPANG